MTMRIFNPPDEVRVNVTYGLGQSCEGRFSRADVEGLPAREIIQRVARSPQQPGRPTRAAQVIGEVLRSERVVDAELMDAPSGKSSGHPITLDDEVVRARGGGEGNADREEVSIRISESYVGGGGTCPAGSSAPSAT
jgi:hypothetical protein